MRRSLRRGLAHPNCVLFPRTDMNCTLRAQSAERRKLVHHLMKCVHHRRCRLSLSEALKPDSSVLQRCASGVGINRLLISAAPNMDRLVKNSEAQNANSPY